MDSPTQDKPTESDAASSDVRDHPAVQGAVFTDVKPPESRPVPAESVAVATKPDDTPPDPPAVQPEPPTVLKTTPSKQRAKPATALVVAMGIFVLLVFLAYMAYSSTK